MGIKFLEIDKLNKKIPLFFNGNKSEDAKLQTYIYSVIPGCTKCTVGQCITYYSYTDENGDTINDSIDVLDGIKTFCSVTEPVITSTSYVGGAGCLTPGFSVSTTECNVLGPSITENNQILYIDNGKKISVIV